MPRTLPVILAIILGCAWTSVRAQITEISAAELRQAVVNLSDDDFGTRERATHILWESGNETLATEIARHGSTNEARSRAAQVVTAYRWGITPGITDAERQQTEKYRLGSLRTRQAALSQLMHDGYLLRAAQCLLLTSDLSQRELLNEHLRGLMDFTIPREFARGHDEEVAAFFKLLQPVFPDYGRDQHSLTFGENEYSTKPLSPTAEKFLSDWWLFVRRGQKVAELQRSNDHAEVFAFYVNQGRIADAMKWLRKSLRAEEETPATEILRRYLLREASRAKAQNYSRKALNLPNTSPYQPIGIDVSTGFRHVISFCHTYELKSLVTEAGEALATQLSKDSPGAMPAFCAWAAHYPELRELAITSAIAAHEAGIPAEFAYGTLCDSHSRRGRWFNKFITSQEQRNLLNSGAQMGGWGKLAAIEAEHLPLQAKGWLAMATGDWAAAATAFSEGTEEANTLAEGAVMAYLTSFSHLRNRSPDMAIKWRSIAESIPLTNNHARAALADTMQAVGDHAGAEKNRKMLISFYRGGAKVDPSPLMHSLRLIAPSLDLTQASDLAFAPRVIERSAEKTGEVAQDAAFYYLFRLANAIAAKRFDAARIELRSAHKSAPGRLEVFEMLATMKSKCPPELLQSARTHLDAPNALWQEAITLFPENTIMLRELEGCQSLLKELQ